jgi:hypothetical protein
VGARAVGVGRAPGCGGGGPLIVNDAVGDAGVYGGGTVFLVVSLSDEAVCGVTAVGC